MQLLLFFAGPQRFGLEVSLIKEVSPLVKFQKELPGLDGIAGLVNYRGVVVPVVDMSVILAGTPAPQAISTRIAFVDYLSHPLGLILERATEMIHCRPEDFQPTGIQGSDERPAVGDIKLDAAGVIQKVVIAQVFPAPLKRALFPHLIEGERP
jgi:chemotaxis-related protein WspB